jgi:hypothetical protein
LDRKGGILAGSLLLFTDVIGVGELKKPPLTGWFFGGNISGGEAAPPGRWKK